MKNTKPVVLLIITGTLLVILLKFLSSSHSSTSITTQQTPPTDDKPQVISTNPTPLEDRIIAPTQTVEITFNFPLENVGEFKNRLEPKTDYRVKLSDDRKTAKIIPTSLFKLGTTFTLFITTDTKFDGGKRLDHELIYHFKTIEYKGV